MLPKVKKTRLALHFKKKLNDCKGFTLIEVISVIVVFAIAIPVLIELLSSTVVKSDKSVYMSRAAVFAQEKMEEIISDKKNPTRGYAWVIEEDRYEDDNPAEGFSRTVTVEGAGYVHNGVSYAFVQVVVSHDLISDVKLTTWLTDY